MTFPIVLLAFGGILFFIGLLGKVQVKEFHAGTDSKNTRILSIVIGIVLMCAAYYVWLEERKGGGQDNVNANKSSNQASTTPSTSPSADNVVFTIDRPKPGNSYEVPLVNGTGQIEIKGTLKGIALDFSKAGIYVFTKTEGNNNEWWYDQDIDPDQNGDWTTIALSGSKLNPTPKDKDKEVMIQAIVSTDDAVKDAIAKNKEKFVNSIDEIKYLKMSAPVTIRIRAKN
jgi:hypothetical protein